MLQRVLIFISWSYVLLLVALMSAASQGQKALLIGSSRESIILRWVVDSLRYPDGGFNVYRQTGERGDWQRLNSQPIVPINDRAKAQLLFGNRFDELENILFAPKAKGLNLRAAIQQDENRKSLALLMADLDAQVAEALGMRFEDRTADENERYTYRLARVDSGHETDVAVVTGERSDEEIGPPEGLRALAKDSVVSLAWTPDQRFSGYNIYRSERKSGTYARVNTAPVLVLETEHEGPPASENSPRRAGKAVVPEVLFKDRSVRRGQTYWYNVSGINPFAQASAPSEQVSVEVRSVILLPVPPRPEVMVRRDTVILTWKDVSHEGVDGYCIYRAVGNPDSMQRVTRRPLRAYSFVDEGLSERTVYFYAIATMDKDGNEGALSPVALADVLDFGAPRPPQGITIRTDTGVIELRWQANTEKDLLGYHVFKASKDTLREHFFQATKGPIHQPVFVDRVPKGADYPFYYRLVAVDSTYSFSGFSPIVSGRLPDIVPPIAPIWKDLRVHKDRIQLSWASNPERDIAGYTLYRRPRGETQWTKLNTTLLSLATTHFADTSAAQGSQYEYMLQALDDANNVSKQSTIVAARRYDADPPKPPASIDVKYDSTRHRILLSWDHASDNTLRGVVVFRSIGENGKFVQKSRLLQDAVFTDGDVKRGESYRYCLRAYDASGNFSEFSRPVAVTVGRPNPSPSR
jgi:uncharacterized protein